MLIEERWRRLGGTFLESIALVVAFASVGHVVLELEPVSGIAALVWPPSGIALAAVLLRGYHLLPAVLIGSALVMRSWNMPPLVIAVVALGNVVDTGLAAYLLRRMTGYQRSLDGLGHVLGLVAAVAVASLLSAVMCTGSLILGGVVSTSMMVRTWRAWWVGNLLGNLIVAPLIISWANVRSFRISAAKLVEATALGLALVGTSIAIFFRDDIKYPFDNPYLFFPLFLWAAHRFGVCGASSAAAVVSGFAVWGTVQGTGPFIEPTLARSLLELQTFLGCAVLTPLVVAGAVADRTRAVRARDDFLAVASHELRTPLAAMLTQVEGLQRAVARNPKVAVGERLAKVASSGRRLERLIEQLLDVTRISGGNLRLEPEPLDLAELVRDVVGRFREASMKVHSPIAVTGESDVRGCWDRTRIDQVITNLIGNALKYGRGKPVVVNLEKNHEAVLCVRDHGIGIDENVQQRIFQKFERAVGTREFGGFGLGLWISRQIVEASGGSIGVRSERGQGSAFIVRLPLDHSLTSAEEMDHGGEAPAPARR